MCHHYIGVRSRPEHLADEFSLRTNLYQLTLPDEGFYPLAAVPLIRLDDAGQREMTAAEWGFLPGWWKPSDRTPKRAAFQRKCINARSEDVQVKPTYREAFRRRRCLMPAEAFFERGHYFHLAGRRPFAFAALWDRWRDADGTALDTCTLLTTEANAAVAAVGHPRMPVVLMNEERYEQWLNPEISERLQLEELLRPTPPELWHCMLASEGPRPRPSAPQDRELPRGVPSAAGGEPTSLTKEVDAASQRMLFE
ncbi:MAG: SOS response-associated peptidase [Pirellulales bacterium]|nr:SOS response-associated peptidase [Pirellulales bacterium]